MLLFAGILFMIVFSVLVGATSRALFMFADLPSLVITLMPLIFFLQASKSGRIIRKYIRLSFKKGYKYDRAELEGIVAAIKNTIKIILATGAFGFVSGMIAILANLSTPEMFGPSAAVSLITLLYSIAISAFVFFPTQSWAENMINGMQ